MDATANAESTQGNAAGAGQQINGQTNGDPATIETKLEWANKRIAELSDLRTARLREIAIDTAVRHLAGSTASQGHAVDTDRIVKSAAVYFAFLDAGTVPA